MNDEVTRTSSADRDRYVDHLPALCAQGFINEEQMDTMTGRLLQAEKLADLDAILDGMPKPPRPRRPRDMGIPENFLPLCSATALLGLTLAIIPAVALSGHKDALSASVAALCMLWGAWATLISICAAVYAGCYWADQPSDVQRERRRRDKQGR